MIGIAFMVYQNTLLGIDIYSVGFVLLIVAVGMTLWSMMIYLRAAWPFILLDEKNP
jgi:CDP-diacylglycerol--glycerol-3-phosphate 3-phosphatidyltransferase/cardiolipin synthase